MNSNRKKFGPSRGSDSVGNRLASRYSDSAPAADAAPAPPKSQPRMVTRSWYLPAETADRLGQAADRIWRAVPGLSKHEALSALLDAGIERADEVQDQLSQTSQNQQD